jgi:hypothetical protein
MKNSKSSRGGHGLLVQQGAFEGAFMDMSCLLLESTSEPRPEGVWG